MKRHAPATARNSAAIAKVLGKELPKTGSVVEIASGSGEHAVYFARQFPDTVWYPTDYEVDALHSIRAWTDEAGLPNIAAPQKLDASNPPWDIPPADAIFCSNLVHISPWAASVGLFAGAAATLRGHAPLILYGPFLEAAINTAQSNLDFEASLKARNTQWGLRNTDDLDALARDAGLARTARYPMPANNLILVYRRKHDN
ncbi:DUF938 domain-containing protein [Pontixanthobacter sp.]|uniref:DUF938 domain-containing protein n=1 Tax=Pontixanthobacter sp. TaxID=2792078 RepID=UPI003C7B2770